MSIRRYPDDFINKVICGDCLEVMKEIPAKSVDMVITSPPYWGLRDYGIGADQLGLELTPELYIEHLTEIFNEVKRVLKKEGTLWLNIGDTYWGGKGKSGYELPHEAEERRQKGGTIQRSYNVPGYMEMRPADGKHDFIQPKCLCMVPERLAWSLIQNGWILRNKIIWYKPNAMPSSVTDRFSNRWEYVFMFSKSQRYYFDLDAVREPHTTSSNGYVPYEEAIGKSWHNHKEDTIKGAGQKQIRCQHPDGKNPGDVFEIGADTRPKAKLGNPSRIAGGGARCQKDPRWTPPEGKRPIDFWKINTQPFPEAHFAVFPEKLCEKPIKAGCPEDGIVLDPFAGAGTALLVAKEMKRNYIGIDIKQDYCKITEERLAQGVL